MTLLVLEKPAIYHVHGLLNYHKCGVFFGCPGSPFLASEDRILGGVIVLRCCRCVEAPSSQNIQGTLGRSISMSNVITVKLLHHSLRLVMFRNP